MVNSGTLHAGAFMNDGCVDAAAAADAMGLSTTRSSPVAGAVVDVMPVDERLVDELVEDDDDDDEDDEEEEEDDEEDEEEDC